MKVIAASLILLASPSVALAIDPCRKVPHDPEFPAGLEGAYEIIGKDAVTGKAYSGQLAISSGVSAYGIARVIEGKIVKGTAWIEVCGGDKIQYLAVRYATTPEVMASCRIGGDGGNYYRVTCRTRTGEMTWRGLESWFQTP